MNFRHNGIFFLNSYKKIYDMKVHGTTPDAFLKAGFVEWDFPGTLDVSGDVISSDRSGF